MQTAALNGMTAAATDANAQILIAIDDGEDTGLFYVDTGDTSAAAAADLVLLCVLQGVSDATI